MKRNILTSLAVLCAIAIAPVPAVQAGSSFASGVAGGVVGGIIGGAIVNNANKKKKKSYSSSGTYSAQRQENREVQTSLNYFNFPAGTPDGVFGGRTRNAISAYQIYMGYPVSGHMTQFQKTVLLTSYHRSIAGGVATSQVVAASPDGYRGLLKNTHQQMSGGGATVMAAAPQQQTIVATQPTAVSTGTGTGAFKMPAFGDGPDTTSMANFCNKISLITNTNGGYTNVFNLTDPLFALNEQFCLARIYAISQSEEMISKVQGVTPQQMQQQCETLGPAFKQQISSLSLGSSEQVVAKTADMIVASGMSPAQLTHTAKICLGVGYRTDNSDVALASTLILVALGEPVYGELLGHHLVNGFGTTQRRDLALSWYVSATNAVASGMPAVFVPGQTDRTALIQTAAAQLETNPSQGGQAASGTFLMPAFNAEGTNASVEN